MGMTKELGSFMHPFQMNKGSQGSSLTLRSLNGVLIGRELMMSSIWSSACTQSSSTWSMPNSSYVMAITGALHGCDILIECIVQILYGTFQSTQSCWRQKADLVWPCRLCTTSTSEIPTVLLILLNLVKILIKL